MSGVADVVKKHKKHLDLLIGRQMSNVFLACCAVSAVFKAFEQGLPGWKSVLSGTATFFLAAALVAFIIGFVQHSQPDSPRPLQALVSGVAAGAFAAVIGGSVYYLFDFQDCAESKSVVKFMRLLPLCAVLSGALGVLLGLIPTGKSPAPSGEQRRGPDGRFQSSTPPTTPPDPMRLFYVILFLAVVAVASALYVEVANNLPRIVGPEIAGGRQGNIVYWQFFVMVGSFTTSFVYLTNYWHGWGGQFPEAPATRALHCALETLLWALLIGLPIALIWGGLDLEVRPAALVDRTCASISWKPALWPEVTFRILILFLWMLASYLAGTLGKRWIVRRFLRSRTGA